MLDSDLTLSVVAAVGRKTEMPMLTFSGVGRATDGVRAEHAHTTRQASVREIIAILWQMFH
jgi:hypothetical protein